DLDQMISAGHLDQHDVVELEIAMDDAARVRVCEPEQHLPDQHDRARRSEPGRVQLGQRPALDELHDNVGPPPVNPEIQDGNAVDMVQPADGAGLPVKARYRRLRFRHFLVQEFQRDLFAELHALATVDDAHAAGADGVEHAPAAIDDHPDERVSAFLGGSLWWFFRHTGLSSAARSIAN